MDYVLQAVLSGQRVAMIRTDGDLVVLDVRDPARVLRRLPPVAEMLGGVLFEAWPALEGHLLSLQDLQSGRVATWSDTLSEPEALDVTATHAGEELVFTIRRGAPARSTHASRPELAALERHVATLRGNLAIAQAEQQTLIRAISHDLQSPLRTISVYSEMLQAEDPITDDSARQLALEIDSVARNSGRMVSKLLEYSRISRETLTLGPIDLSLLLHRLCQQHEADIQQRRAQIRIIEPMPVVVTSEILLSQVLNNLLSNALKYVPRDRAPEITVQVEIDERGPRIWVLDNGIGVPEASAQRIFKPFERLHGRASKEYPGTGLGLAIAARAIERIGGQLGMTPRPEGGSGFWVALPESAVRQPVGGVSRE